MDRRLQAVLIKKYPILCQETQLTIHQSCMAWGFDVGDGWFKILDELLEKLSKHDGVILAQVKEKFGLLRVYINNGTDEVYKIIDEYESKSAHVCETCGDPGKSRGGGWIYTVCDSCHVKFEAGKRPWQDDWDDKKSNDPVG